MAPAKVQITTGGTPLAQCDGGPQLMPFHVAYSGPAPISTFFRVKEMKEELPSSSSSSDLSGTSGGRKDPVANGVNGEENTVVNGIGKMSLGKKLVAAFRGRRVVGVEVPLPEGYAGVVLRSDTSASSLAKAVESQRYLYNGVERNGRRKASTRGTRRSKPIEIDEDEDGDPSSVYENGMDPDGDLLHSGLGHDGEVKTLKATQTFQSIVVWNPDVIVDEGRDEYIRALQEWTTVASEVHRMED